MLRQENQGTVENQRVSGNRRSVESSRLFTNNLLLCGAGKLSASQVLRKPLINNITNSAIPGPADTDIIYILPISGMYFPLQLLALTTLQRSIGDIAPNLVLGTSGGSVVGAAGMSAFWKSADIHRHALEMTSDQIFTRPSRYLSKMLNFIFVQSIAFPKPDVYKFAKNMLCGKLDQGTEMIIDTYCINSGAGHVFSTKSPETSRFSSPTVKYFLNKDWEKAMRVVLASCAIPNIIRPMNIFTKYDSLEQSKFRYCDGGISAPSPWAVLWDKLVFTTKKLKIVYFMSTSSSVNSTFDMIAPLYFMINSQCRREAADIISLFKMRIGEANVIYKSCKTADEAGQLYLSAEQALLFIKTDHAKHGYNFDIFNFGRRNMAEILGREDILEYALYYC